MDVRGLIAAGLTGMMVAASAAGSGTASAAPVSGTSVVRAGDDAFVSSTRPAQNFGTVGKLMVGNDAGQVRVSYVKFTIGALPAGATVTHAVLRLAVTGTPTTRPVSVYRVATGWSQRTITAATAPALPATAVASIRPKVTDTALAFNVSTVATAAGTYAFAIKSAGAGVMRLRSAESTGTAAPGPTLTLTYASAATTPPTSEPCVTGALLVPTCGVLWGAAAGGFTSVPSDRALLAWEQTTGRTATLFHAYHRGDELFPNKAEIAMTRDPAHPRILMLNWKVAYGTNWAAVAAGRQDARIDRWAAYVKANFHQKFFLLLHHEPENDVVATAGSGMTAKDYAAMYRHTVVRLRQDGVSNAIQVVGYMGNEKWMAMPWWPDLYPGDEVVDWVGLDSYVSVEPGTYHYGDFGDLLDRAPTGGGGQGWYQWAVTHHPTKPIMVAEWGMYHRLAHPTSKAAAYATVLPNLFSHPKIKAIAYFDTPDDSQGDRNIAVNSTPASLAAFRSVAANPIFNVAVLNP